MQTLKPGNLTMTAGIAAAGLSLETLAPYLGAHLTGNWGDLDPADAAIQNIAFAGQESNDLENFMFMSVWKIQGHTVWIITHYGYATTILFPEER
jgi:hypothetical protein